MSIHYKVTKNLKHQFINQNNLKGITHGQESEVKLRKLQITILRMRKHPTKQENNKTVRTENVHVFRPQTGSQDN